MRNASQNIRSGLPKPNQPWRTGPLALRPRGILLRVLSFAIQLQFPGPAPAFRDRMRMWCRDFGPFLGREWLTERPYLSRMTIIFSMIMTL